jgi:hypothetical protein
MIDTNLLFGGREPRHLARQVGAHHVSRRTSLADRMEGRGGSVDPWGHLALWLPWLHLHWAGGVRH